MVEMGGRNYPCDRMSFGLRGGGGSGWAPGMP
jgi:hypothetical protein